MEDEGPGCGAGTPKRWLVRDSLGRSHGWLLTLGLYLAIFAVFSVFSNNFFTIRSLLNLLVQTSTITILSIGSALVLIVGGVDFSLGAVIALSGTAVVVCAVTGTPIWLSMIVAMSLGGVVGIANGFLVARLRLPSFMATVAVATLLHGLLGAFGAFAASHPPPFPLPDSLGDLANDRVFKIFSQDAEGKRMMIFPGVSWIVVIMVFVALFFHVILAKTRIGRYLYVVGSSQGAAHFSGIDVIRVKILAYALAGLLAGLVGVLLASRMMGPPGGAAGYEMIGIICAMIGGASLLGGRGSVIGTVIGSFILSTLSMGLTMMNSDKEYVPMLLNGLVVLLAVYLDQRRASR